METIQWKSNTEWFPFKLNGSVCLCMSFKWNPFHPLKIYYSVRWNNEANLLLIAIQLHFCFEQESTYSWYFSDNYNRTAVKLQSRKYILPHFRRNVQLLTFFDPFKFQPILNDDYDRIEVGGFDIQSFYSFLLVSNFDLSLEKFLIKNK